ncbi:O-antigen ligase family protein [Litoribacter populi]|uniref:O-antigen ligase family protein n=1 Tax=Litoribacter populi TaxID=2598460 RepID=UPI00163DBF87|nr:O-antigen ligase family protein [Litoribacter populi]
MVYLFLYKKEKALLYLPVIFFAQSFIETAVPASIHAVLVLLLMLTVIDKNVLFFHRNIWSFLIVIWFSYLLVHVRDLEPIRSVFLNVTLLFVAIPLAMSIFSKYTKEEMLDELSRSAAFILGLFLLNVMFSTAFNYSPTEMYGIKSGILYGKLYATDFNVLSTATFVVLLRILKKYNLIYVVLLIFSVAFIMLTMRRSVMILTMLGLGIGLMLKLDGENIKSFFMIIVVAGFVGFVVILNTSFMDMFIERYEARKLDERELKGEHRFMEYEMIYRDMFVYYDYSPWTGYELFNSAHNYGKGAFGERSLHSDVTNLTHASGIPGLVLYFLLVTTAFVSSFRNLNTKWDNYIFLFCVGSFVFYTVTGRYATISSHWMIFALLSYPLSMPDADKNDGQPSDKEEVEEIPHAEYSL